MLSIGNSLSLSHWHFLLFRLVLLNRSNDSSILCGGAVRWKNSDRWMWGKRTACRICSHQEGHSLLSAGRDSSACPWLLSQFCCTSPRSVRDNANRTLVLLYILQCILFIYFFKHPSKPIKSEILIQNNSLKNNPIKLFLILNKKKKKSVADNIESIKSSYLHNGTGWIMWQSINQIYIDNRRGSI